MTGRPHTLRVRLAQVAAAVGARRSRARIAFVVGLVAVGTVAIYVSAGVLGDSHPTASHVVLALGEALLVAGLLALAADPFVQRRFAEEWGQGLFWAIFNRDAPESLRRAVNELAQPARITMHEVWTLELEWVDAAHEHLTLRVDVERRVRCVSREGWHPIEVRSGLVTDCEGKPSRFLGFSVNATSWTMKLDERNIHECVTVDANNTATLDAGPKLTQRRVGYLDEVVLRTVMQTKVRAIDGIPLFNESTVLDWKLVVHGSAVPDLFVELFGSRTPGVRLEEVTPDRRIFKPSGADVTFPGHGLLLQWRPNAGRASGDNAAAANL
jgi:hypothetical protein